MRQRELERRGRQRCVVLASGDPLFYGVARYLCDRLGKDRFEVLPHVSSMQLAFARVKESWEDAYLTSLAGRPMVVALHPAQIQGVFDMAPYVDGFALSFYPHYSKWNATFMPASMFDELWDLLARVGKPAGFSEAGWPAESFDVFGSPFATDAEKQARFLRLSFAEAHRAPVPIEFFVNFRTLDGDQQWQRLLAWSQQQPPLVSAQFVEFYKYFRDIGIFDGAGLPRAATAVWREELARPYQPRP